MDDINDENEEVQRKEPFFEYICKFSDIVEGGKRCFQLPSTKRSLLLIKLLGKLYCIDQTCYHHGGPLVNGDIEELGGITTVKCPWHAYHIAISSGEGLYMGIDMARDASGKMVHSAPRLKSKGIKQRTHLVEIRGEDVYIADSSLLEGSTIIESDIYAFKGIEIIEPPNGSVKIHSRFE